ncbi:MAG: type II secretion system protein [Planctomycetes bacterium]|nr:type II secretion system protein [Planctomycetota bacterium]
MISKKTGACAFTLIELLVVVGIIAILMAILLPALSSARNEGTKTKCLANMRAIGMALETYSMDDERGFTSPIHPKAETEWLYDGEYEYGGKTGLDVMGDPDFRQENRILNKYIFGNAMSATLALYECPGDRGVPDAPVDFEPFFVEPAYKDRKIFDLAGTSYRLNNHIDFLGGSGFSQNFYGPYFRPRTRVPSTAQTVILEEAIAEVAKWNAATYPVTGWHAKRNRFNVAFVDGHAGPIYLSQQNDLTANYPNYWVLRGDQWRMDCYPENPVPDLP